MSSVQLRWHVVFPEGHQGASPGRTRFSAPATLLGCLWHARGSVRTRNAAGVVAELVSAFTEAVTAVFGDDCRDDVLVELVGQPTSRSGLGGKVISNGSAGE